MKKVLCFSIVLLLTMPSLATAKKKHGMGSSFEDVMPGDNISQPQSTQNTPAKQDNQATSKKQKKHQDEVKPAPADSSNNSEPQLDISEEEIEYIRQAIRHSLQKSGESGSATVQKSNTKPFFKQHDGHPGWVDLQSSIIKNNGNYYAVGVTFIEAMDNEDLQKANARAQAILAAQQAITGFTASVTRGYSKDGSRVEHTRIFTQAIGIQDNIEYWSDENKNLYAASFIPLSKDELPPNYLELKRKAEPVTVTADSVLLDDSIAKIKVPRRAPEWLTENSYGHTKIGDGDALYAIGLAKTSNNYLTDQSALADAAATMCKGYAKEQYMEDNALLKSNSITYECTFHGLQFQDRWKAKDGTVYYYIVQRLFEAIALD